MKAIAALLLLALCNSATLVQAGRCWGIIWNNNCYGVGWRTAQPKILLTNVVNKLVEGSRRSLANLHIDNVDLGEQGSFQDVTLRNLETFQVGNIELGNIFALEVKNLSVTVNILNLNGSYDLIDFDFPLVGKISGSGKFSVNLSNVDISASLSFKPEGLGKIIVEDVTNIRVNVQAGLALLEGVEGGDAVNNALSAIIPDAVREAVPQLLENNKQDLINFLNNKLNNIV